MLGPGLEEQLMLGVGPVTLLLSCWTRTQVGDVRKVERLTPGPPSDKRASTYTSSSTPREAAGPSPTG